MTVLLLSFQVRFFFYFLFFLVRLLWLRLPILYWIKMVKVGTLILFLISEGMLSAFTIEYDVSYGVIIYGLCYVEVCFFYVHFLESFLESFYHKWMLNFVKSFFFFSCIFWDDHMVFILQLVDVVYYIDWFVDIEKSLYLG